MESFGPLSGSQYYLDHLPGYRERTARIVVRAFVEGRQFEALLDTGASSCVLAWDVAVALAPAFGWGDPEIRALGGAVHHGRSFLLTLTFPADEGEDLTVDTTAWASETFPGPSLIGYGGLLEKIRFAVDPAQNLLYFGA